MSVFKAYIMHPITGLSGEELFSYYDDIIKSLPDGIRALSPLAGKEFLQDWDYLPSTGYNAACCQDHAIFERDQWMVRQADILFCDFTGAEKVSIGCCMELAMGALLGKHTVLVMDKDNCHNHAFVKEAADVIFDTPEEGIQYLKSLCGGAV